MSKKIIKICHHVFPAPRSCEISKYKLKHFSCFHIFDYKLKHDWCFCF